jgi:hypothetical protein
LGKGDHQQGTKSGSAGRLEPWIVFAGHSSRLVLDVQEAMLVKGMRGRAGENSYQNQTNQQASPHPSPRTFTTSSRRPSLSESTSSETEPTRTPSCTFTLHHHLDMVLTIQPNDSHRVPNPPIGPILHQEAATPPYIQVRGRYRFHPCRLN